MIICKNSFCNIFGRFIVFLYFCYIFKGSAYPHPSNISGLVLNNCIFKPATQLVKHGFSILNYFRYFLAWPGILSLNACVLVRISVWEGLEHPRHKKNMTGGGKGGVGEFQFGKV